MLPKFKDYPVINKFHPDCSSRKKINLVLDLDHTLIHSFYKTKFTTTQIKSYKNQYGKNYRDIEFVMHVGNVPNIFKQFMIIRETVPEFLEKVSQTCNLFVNTKGRVEYAKEVIQGVDPDGRFNLLNHFKAATKEDYDRNDNKDHKNLHWLLELAKERYGEEAQYQDLLKNTLIIDDSMYWWDQE